MNPGWVKAVSDPFLHRGGSYRWVQLKSGRRVEALVEELFYSKPQ